MAAVTMVLPTQNPLSYSISVVIGICMDFMVVNTDTVWFPPIHQSVPQRTNGTGPTTGLKSKPLGRSSEVSISTSGQDTVSVTGCPALLKQIFKRSSHGDAQLVVAMVSEQQLWLASWWVGLENSMMWRLGT